MLPAVEEFDERAVQMEDPRARTWVFGWDMYDWKKLKAVHLSARCTTTGRRSEVPEAAEGSGLVLAVCVRRVEALVHLDLTAST